ncbi:unnamed protein product [Effrenium voratum]|uniref:Uncharacterized protein n=1 Tax=Effrenium voratum TaxID=2562239 RepID=A0AA36N4X3_9DINO|nr:unnamed protein product [Effrenium voratum]CAJ1390678.1 unnamed protein product [Effrenium voratum]CAJ1454794.1 unnamed protein product [Effrenium voratum]CAJ1454796.1 unnamed protein product [Effrenium voratum]
MRHIVLEGWKVSLQRSINDAMLARDTGAPSGAPADVRLVASLGGGVAERCAHGSCDLELHACCPHCLQQLCCEHWRSSLCHEHGSAATCRCGDCKLFASARTNTYASNANHEEALDIELTPTQSAQSLTSEQGESLMLAEDDGHEEETGAVEGNPSQRDSNGSNRSCVKVSRVRHHTLRLGLSAGCAAKMGKPAFIGLTEDGASKWEQCESIKREFSCGNAHKPGQGVERGRGAQAAEGPSCEPLTYSTPASSADMGRADFRHGFDFEARVTTWISDYLERKHDFQQSDLSKHVAVRNYMIGPQLDKSGRGFHYQVMTLIRRGWSAQDARDWTEQLEMDFRTHFHMIDPALLGGSASRCTVVKHPNGEKHAGYACHSHNNPWPVKQ